MVRLSLSDFYDILNVLMDQGWVQRKGNSLTPYKENQAYYKIQWRVPLGKICQALHQKGYFLPGFASYGVLPSSEQENSEKSKYFKVSLASKVKNNLERKNKGGINNDIL